ncbi:GNAT family N-acetyltransferase [Pseudoxanthomonas kalamensis DSM 18571]|uniref:GNAT family N-acetyltransferase n=1 Tax=Pseudoxanthomonas kalamensis TaxID=289483 RepID=UPI0013920370|nr:GNAT family N-acetyltransferase [Pseudoxanthomonas kalamensis]KAF1709216.1 GNAT family N-acetyltransferase [Pseudoxanthomonas kalamensis DSM 18571]
MKHALLLETPRLRLSLLSDDSPADADFALRLLNDADFIANIGDRGVRTQEQARIWLRDGPVRSYREHGYGMYRVDEKAGDRAAGVCGLVSRPGLDGPDLGYALLPECRGRGYAVEAAAAVLEHARGQLRLGRLLAIVNPDNTASAAVLQKLGFGFATMVRLPGDTRELRLFRFPAPGRTA